MASLEEQDANKNVAIIFGVTGLVGKELAKKLVSKSNWKVYGVARKPEIAPIKSSSYHFISCDLLNSLETQKKLSGLQDVTHMYWITWHTQFQFDTIQSSEMNMSMMSNALNAILPTAKDLKHVSLQTGTNHYTSLEGPFDTTIVQIYDEESPRKGRNFYYALEDLLNVRLAIDKVAWSVQRPAMLLGTSLSSFNNIIGCLGVYGTICKYLNLPFVFGGTRVCWEEVCVDGSDARLVAEQHIWVSTNDQICCSNGEAFNAINGPSFTWKDIWSSIGRKLGAQVPEKMFSEDFSYAREMKDKNGVWEEIVKKHGLVGIHKVDDMANWEFMDNLFRCPFKLLTTREKVDRAGFNTRYNTLDSIFYWIDIMRDERLIP